MKYGDLLAVHGISRTDMVAAFHGIGVIGKTSALKTAKETFLLHHGNW